MCETRFLPKKLILDSVFTTFFEGRFKETYLIQIYTNSGLFSYFFSNQYPTSQPIPLKTSLKLTKSKNFTNIQW